MTMLSADAGAIAPEDVNLTPRSSEELRELALQMYLGTDQAKQLESAGRKKHLAAHRPLQRLAVGHTILAVIIAMAMQRHLSAGDPRALLLVICNGAIAAGFWALWGWSLVEPLPAAIVGLLMYVSLCFLSFAGAPTHRQAVGTSPLIVIFRIWAVVMLTRAIIFGSRERAAKQLENAELPMSPKKRGDIASAIFLYLILLTIVVIPRSLAADHDLNLKDLFDVHKLVAIITITWAIIAWRDVLPAIRKHISLSWCGLGILLGLGTFAVASIYGDLTAYLFGLHPAQASLPYRDAGYSWFAVVAIIAAFPAIFEELAFRGIILPCLGRVLSIKESIAVSGMMFMMLHLTVPSAPPLLLVGILLGILRQRSGSLWPCICMHFTHNAMCVLFERLM